MRHDSCGMNHENIIHANESHFLSRKLCAMPTSSSVNLGDIILHTVGVCRGPNNPLFALRNATAEVVVCHCAGPSCGPALTGQHVSSLS